MNIPVLHVEERSLAKAYEEALKKLYKYGINIKTQYDKDGDPKSIDATMNITILYPFSEPMIHKAFPAGIEDLREYVMELEGVKDHWVKNMNDLEDTRWEYTYHQRLADWGTWFEKRPPYRRQKMSYNYNHGTINQIEQVVNKLAVKLYTRRAQMITWMPFMDNKVEDSPCLQSLWYRIIEHNDDKYLNCNVRFRSNDAWGAFFMNAFGIIHFNKNLIMDKLQELGVKNMKMGRLNWQADSWHIYGKDIKTFKERFYDRLYTTSFDERTYNFSDSLIQEIWKESETNIKKKIKEYDKTHV